MINASDKRKYRGFKVEQKVSGKGTKYVKFVVGDNKLNNQTKQWEQNGYYNCTAFQDLPTFADGVEYYIKKINSIERFHLSNGNDYYNLILEIELVNGNNVSTQNNVSYYNSGSNNNVFNGAIANAVEENVGQSSFDIMEDDIQF